MLARSAARSVAAAVALAGCSFPQATSAGPLDITPIPVPAAPASVFTKPGDYNIYLREMNPNGKLAGAIAYSIKGACWSPTSVGTDPVSNTGVFQGEFSKWYLSDLDMMAKAGINTVRVYHDFGPYSAGKPILDEMYRRGIKIIMQVDSPVHGSVANLANITTVVNNYKNHPAILGFSVANEWDVRIGASSKYYWIYDTLQAAANFVQEGAARVKQLDPNHPVFTFIADPHIPGVHPLSQTRYPYETGELYTTQLLSTCSSIDVWGCNTYRNANIGDLPNQWKSISTKPMVLGEFGADSWNASTGAEDQAMQASFNGGLIDQINFNLASERVGGSLAGYFVFEWNNEHWKNGTPLTQTVSWEPNTGQPDFQLQEEYFGIVNLDRTPKAAFNVLSDRAHNGWRSATLKRAPNLSASSSFTATFTLDGANVHSLSGGQSGGRGINLGILDTSTGIRLSSVNSYDTWVNVGNFTPLTTALQSLPNGSVYMIAVADEGGFADGPGSTSQRTTSSVTTFVNLMKSYGSTKVDKVLFWDSWAVIGVKGQGILSEAIGHYADSGIRQTVTINATPTLTLNPAATLLPLPGVTEIPSPLNNFHMTIVDPAGAAGSGYRIDTSTQLRWWEPLTWVPRNASGTTSLSVPAPATEPRAFFRVVRE